MKDKFKEFFIKDKFYAVLLAGIIINILCFCVFSCNPLVVHAASDVVVNYPLIIDFEKNPSECTLEGIQNAFTFMWGDLPEHYVIFCSYKGQGYRNGSHGWDYYDYYEYIISPTPSFDYPGVLNTSSSDYFINNPVIYYFNYDTAFSDFNSWNTASNQRRQFSYSQISQGYGYILYATDEQYFSTGNVLVWSYPPTTIPEGGDPSAPDMSSLDLDSSLNTTTIPSAPTYSNNFNDPLPTYDSSAPFSSLFDIIIWGFNRVHSVFQSFREYLFSWLGYFINILTYLIQKIIDAIKYIVNWLYNQFLNWLTPYLKIWSFISGLLFNEDDQKSVFDLILDFLGLVAQWLAQFWQNSFIVEYWNNLNDLFDDVLTKIDNVVTAIDNLRILFTADPDYSLIITQFYSTYIGQIYQAIMRLLAAIFDGFKSVQAPATLSFTVNFASAPAPFNEVGYLTFDFNWYEGIRDVIVPIVTTCIYFGFGLHIAWSWRSLLFDTASLKPDVTIRPLGSIPSGSKSYSASSSSGGGGLVPTWRTYPGQKRLRG